MISFFSFLRCSGRQSCEVAIPDYELHDHADQPCPKDMFAYLEAAYECVDGKLLFEFKFIVATAKKDIQYIHFLCVCVIC